MDLNSDQISEINIQLTLIDIAHSKLYFWLNICFWTG